MTKDKSDNGCRVLLVEDDVKPRQTLAAALEAVDCQVEYARDGQEALARIEETSYEVIVIDVHLPKLDGIEVLRRIRKRHILVPVVLMTAHAYVDTAVEAMKLGAADFLEKPVASSDIQSLVRRMMRESAPRDELPTSLQETLSEARLQLEGRQFDAAEPLIRHALRLDPTSPDAFNLLGALTAMTGDRIASQRYFRAALSLDPTHSSARENLARVSERPFRQKMVLGE